MTVLNTRLDLFEVGRAYVKSRARRIDPAQIDIAGSDINLFVGSTSFMTFAVQRQLVERINAVFLDGCDDEDLDRWGYDRYRLLRKGASPARTTCMFERPTATGGSGSIIAGSKFKTQTGIEYVTTQPISFGPSALRGQSYVRAVQAGKDYQVGANAIRFPSSGQLFDPSIIINNPTPAAGGENRESNDVFRERIRGFWNAVGKGTVGAIEYGALGVPGVESAYANEVSEFSPVLGISIPARIIELFVADSSGLGSDALSAAVSIELEEWRAGGIYVLVRSSIPQLIGISLALTFQANVDTASLTAAIASSIVEYVNSLGVNQPLLRHDLGAVLSRFKAAGLIPNDGTIVTPTGDLIPESGKTLRMRPENLALAA